MTGFGLGLGKWKLGLALGIVVLVVAVGVYLGNTDFYASPCPRGATLRSFVIIANDTTGYNGSRYQPFQIAVHNGDCILVTFVNNSTSQPHGLAIAYYENSGLVVQPNKSENVKFLATKSGQFRVSEQISSTVYLWNSNAGILNVA